PRLSWREIIDALGRAGSSFNVKAASSHGWLINKEARRVAISSHQGEVSEGTVKAIIKQAGLSLSQFQQLVRAPTLPGKSYRGRRSDSSRRNKRNATDSQG